jgi:hypothetical protein
MIDRDQTLTVLQACQRYDSRTVADDDVAAWLAVFSAYAPAGLTVEDLERGVVAYYAQPYQRRATVGDILALGRERAESRVALLRQTHHQQALEAAPVQVTGNRSRGVEALLGQLRQRLRPGRPEQLHRREVLRWDRQRGQQQDRRRFDPSGLGFCVPCSGIGRVRLATDPVSGSACGQPDCGRRGGDPVETTRTQEV